MQVKIVRIDKTLPLPKYHTPGSAAFDLYSRTDAVLKPGEVKFLPSNFIIEVPAGYVLIIAGRSSAFKRGLHVDIGVIDQDFNGPEDEVLISLRNFSANNVEIKRGDRLAQGLFLPLEKIDLWTEVNTINNISRRGFGSTGI